LRGIEVRRDRCRVSVQRLVLPGVGLFGRVSARRNLRARLRCRWRQLWQPKRLLRRLRVRSRRLRSKLWGCRRALRNGRRPPLLRYDALPGWPVCDVHSGALRLCDRRAVLRGPTLRRRPLHLPRSRTDLR